MKKVCTLLLALALICTAAGCGGKQAGTDEGQTGGGAASADGGVIKIGFVDCLSGGSASMGVPNQEGVLLAVKEINAKGGVAGKQVELVCYDDEADPATSVTQSTKLVQQDKVLAAITGSASGCCNANKQVFADAGIPCVVSVGTADDIVGTPEVDTFATTFRTGANESYMIEIMANRILDKGYQHVGVIADTSAYGQLAVETIKKVFETYNIGIEIIVTHEPGAADLTSQVLSMQQAGCDFIYSYNLGADAALTCKTIKRLNWEVDVAGARGLNMDTFLSLAGDAAEGVLIPTDINIETEKMQEFKKLYDAEYKEIGNYMFPAMGYTAAMTLFQALEASGGEGGEALISALEALSYESVLGQTGATISFSPSKHEGVDTRRMTYLTVDDGNLVVFDANTFEPNA